MSKPESPGEKVQLTADQLKAEFNTDMVAFLSSPEHAACAAAAIKSFTAWAEEVAKTMDRDEIKAAYIKLERMLLDKVRYDPIMRALHAQLMITSRYCEVAYAKIVPLKTVRATVEQAREEARLRDAAVNDMVKSILHEVEVVIRPEDGTPMGVPDYDLDEELPDAPVVVPPARVNAALGVDVNKTPKRFDN